MFAAYGKTEPELYFYREALKASSAVSEYFLSARAIAVVKAKEGFHKSALKDLENLYPLARLVEPAAYFDYLNSMAVELGEAGRLYEAKNICDAVLASPFAFAYPEWKQTAQDLRGANRSIVAINRSQRTTAKIMLMPVREAGFAAADADIQPARILEFEYWKRKMAKDKEKNGGKRREAIPQKDMLLEIMALYTSNTTTDEQRYKIYAAVMKSMREPKTPPPDNPQGA